MCTWRVHWARARTYVRASPHADFGSPHADLGALYNGELTAYKYNASTSVVLDRLPFRKTERALLGMLVAMSCGRPPAIEADHPNSKQQTGAAVAGNVAWLGAGSVTWRAGVVAAESGSALEGAKLEAELAALLPRAAAARGGRAFAPNGTSWTRRTRSHVTISPSESASAGTSLAPCARRRSLRRCAPASTRS